MRFLFRKEIPRRFTSFSHLSLVFKFRFVFRPYFTSPLYAFFPLFFQTNGYTSIFIQYILLFYWNGSPKRKWRKKFLWESGSSTIKNISVNRNALNYSLQSEQIKKIFLPSYADKKGKERKEIAEKNSEPSGSSSSSRGEISFCTK